MQLSSEVFMVVWVCNVILWVVAFAVHSNISEDHSSSIFRVEDRGSMFLPNVTAHHRYYMIQQPHYNLKKIVIFPACVVYACFCKRLIQCKFLLAQTCLHIKLQWLCCFHHRSSFGYRSNNAHVREFTCIMMGWFLMVCCSYRIYRK